MKRIILTLTVLAASILMVFAASIPPAPAPVPPPPTSGVSANTLLRLCDGIGWQYVSISGALKYGFGGLYDTLPKDTTVSRGTLRNIRRLQGSSDAALSELLPIFISSRTTLGREYMYTKWSSVCWGLNNFYSQVGGLSARITAKSDSGRLSFSFAEIARGNGIYLQNKTVFSPPKNLGYGVFSGDSTFTYSDSANIDSSLYGPAYATQLGDNSQVIRSSESATATCSLIVFGANQSLIHGRKWWTSSTGMDVSGLKPYVAGDSLYGIDSVKAKAFDVSGATGAMLFQLKAERNDSL